MQLEQSIKLVEGAKPIFGEQFYERLFQQHPDLRGFFSNTSIRRQAVMLTMQLNVIEAYYVRHSEAAGLYLQVLGTRHQDRGIPQEAFDYFCDVLLESLREFHGSDWTDELELQWRKAIEASTQKMFEGYELRYHV